VDRAGLWESLATDWVCLDAELMPWSVKAQELVRQQYAAVGTAARLGLEGGIGALTAAVGAEFVARGRRGLVQPALKCRGPEYLRIIYGPEYSMPEHLERLRVRGLSAKRSLALREFALGIEALERFGRGEPLHRVHECVFGVLALESEPVDSRL
jgi:protein phosphatase